MVCKDGGGGGKWLYLYIVKIENFHPVLTPSPSKLCKCTSCNTNAYPDAEKSAAQEQEEREHRVYKIKLKVSLVVVILNFLFRRIEQPAEEEMPVSQNAMPNELEPLCEQLHHILTGMVRNLGHTIQFICLVFSNHLVIKCLVALSVL